MSEDALYFYLNDDDQPVGPMRLEEIERLAKAGVIADSVMICESGGEEWVSLSERRKPEEEESSAPVPLPPPLAPPSPPAPPPGLPNSGGQLTIALNADWLPVASMSLGVLSVFGACFPLFGIALAIIGGALGVGALLMKVERHRPLAIAGLVGSAAGIVIAIVVWLGLFGFGGDPISRVFQQCEKVGKEAERRFRNDPGRQATFIAREFQKIDASDCPADFRVAFQEHINAWERAAPYFAADTPLNAFLEGFYSGYFDDPSAFGWSNRQAAIAAQGIQETYYRMRTVAAAHGAAP